MASPSFSINGGTVDIKASVAAASPVVGTLDDLAGVRSVVWTLTRTDETNTPASYVLTPSGSIGQIITTTSLGAGTAGVLKATINGGLDEATDQPSPATSQEVKFFVPLGAGGEVLVQGETDSSAANPDRLSSVTHGAVDPINASIRSANDFAGERSVPGVAGRQINDNDTLTVVGGLVLKLGTTGFSATGRTLIIEALLSTSDVGNTTRMDLFNLTTSQVVGSVLTSLSLTPERVTLDVTAEVGTSLLEDTVNIIQVRLAQTSTDAAELAICDNITVEVDY